jgi:DNA polymerase-3 subunit gamma/tau
MKSSSLNLARAWRPRNFDEIVGQELAVRLVKNSLYRNQLFPVYLLAGQRGCGKTTLARVFAAAINCSQRENFSKNPKETLLPCQTCPSCMAMKQGSHPDFHEIDAASHTGVDNVRSLIDAATFLPGLGQKKIYLIDEAHMLSKAAFNAFLKIMEEPPATVTFMLATTDPHKIIETVRSRCFQLFFNPLPTQQLHDHLAHICTKENITFESKALYLIAQESEGSVRDAQNRLEQIYLANGSVTYRDTLAILGDISFEQLIQLCDLALQGDHQNLIGTLQASNLKQYSAAQIWKKTVDLLRAVVWIKHGVCEELFEQHKEQLTALAQRAPTHHLLKVLELWYQTEPLFNKTQAQEILLESLFIRMAPTMSLGPEDKKVTEQKPTVRKAAPTQTTHTTKQTPSVQVQQPAYQTQTKQVEPEQPVQAPRIELSSEPVPQQESTRQQSAPERVPESTPWETFLNKIISKDDPLALSIFKQAQFIKHESQVVTLQFEEQNVFFKDLIEQPKAVWQPLLREVFGNEATVHLEFVASKNPTSKPAAQKFESAKAEAPSLIKPAQQVQPTANRPTQIYTKPTQQAAAQKTIHRLDVRDREQWKQVHTVLDMFPGTVTEEKEINHE